MKKLLLIQLLIFVQFALFAEKVPFEQAKTAALNHFKLMYETVKGNDPGLLTMNLSFEYTLSNEFTAPSFNQTNDVLFYVYNVNGSDGFVIVSADNSVLPIIGYSLESHFTGNAIPPGPAYMLNQYASEIDYAIKHVTEIDESVSQAWTNLLEGNSSGNLKSTSNVDQLCSTQWNQAPYYNDLCPYDYSYNELTVTGCPATAMAQIMKYWNYPTTGTGYHSYNHDTYGTLSANFSAETYNWSAMPNGLSGSNTAIATLMYHCGVGVEMQYGVAATGGSGGYVIEDASPIQHCCEYAFKNYFGYKTTMHGELRQNYSDAYGYKCLKQTWMPENQSSMPVLDKAVDTPGFVTDTTTATIFI
ncbi:MAG: C10 family peptidase [Bacteroidales bacterium]